VRERVGEYQGVSKRVSEGSEDSQYTMMMMMTMVMMAKTMLTMTMAMMIIVMVMVKPNVMDGYARVEGTCFVCACAHAQCLSIQSRRSLKD